MLNFREHSKRGIALKAMILVFSFVYLFSSVTPVLADNSDPSINDFTKVFERNYYGDDPTRAHQFNYSDDEQSFTITNTGMYRIEAYGASGQDYTGLPFPNDPTNTTASTITNKGGKGGSVSFTLNLNKGDKVCVKTGKVGGGGQATPAPVAHKADSTEEENPFYGDSLSSDKLFAGNGSSGGEATRVYVNGVLVAVAAGGGGATSLGVGGDAIPETVAASLPTGEDNLNLECDNEVTVEPGRTVEGGTLDEQPTSCTYNRTYESETSTEIETCLFCGEEVYFTNIYEVQTDHDCDMFKNVADVRILAYEKCPNCNTMTTAGVMSKTNTTNPVEHVHSVEAGCYSRANHVHKNAQGEPDISIANDSTSYTEGGCYTEAYHQHYDRKEQDWGIWGPGCVGSMYTSSYSCSYNKSYSRNHYMTERCALCGNNSMLEYIYEVQTGHSCELYEDNNGEHTFLAYKRCLACKKIYDPNTLTEVLEKTEYDKYLENQKSSIGSGSGIYIPIGDDSPTKIDFDATAKKSHTYYGTAADEECRDNNKPNCFKIGCGKEAGEYILVCDKQGVADYHAGVSGIAGGGDGYRAGNSAYVKTHEHSGSSKIDYSSGVDDRGCYTKPYYHHHSHSCEYKNHYTHTPIYHRHMYNVTYVDSDGKTKEKTFFPDEDQSSNENIRILNGYETVWESDGTCRYIGVAAFFQDECPGGCYTMHTHIHTEKCMEPVSDDTVTPKFEYVYNSTNSTRKYEKVYCYHGDGSNPEPNAWVPDCGYTSETVVDYVKYCGRREGELVGYALNCGLTPLEYHHHTGNSSAKSGCYTTKHSHYYFDQDTGAKTNSTKAVQATGDENTYSHTVEYVDKNVSWTCPVCRDTVTISKKEATAGTTTKEHTCTYVGEAVPYTHTVEGQTDKAVSWTCPVCSTVVKVAKGGENVTHECVSVKTPLGGCYIKPAAKASRHTHTWKCSKDAKGKYTCGNLPVNMYLPACEQKFDTACGYYEGQPIQPSGNCVDEYTPASGGTNYICDEAKNSLSSADNEGDGTAYICYQSEDTTYEVPYSGDYEFTGSDGDAIVTKTVDKQTVAVGGAFTGKLHLEKGDIVSTVIGNRGTYYQVFVNDKLKLEFHYHKGWNRYIPDKKKIEPGDVDWRKGNPKGCFKGTKHKHDHCPSHKETRTITGPCGTPYSAIKIWLDPHCSETCSCSNYVMWYRCPYHQPASCGTPNNYEDAGKICQVTTTKRVTYTVWDCGYPINVWERDCGYENTQAVYDEGFYDVSIDATLNPTIGGKSIHGPYLMLTLYKIDYDIEIDPNGGYLNILGEDFKDKPIVRTELNSKKYTLKTQTGSVAFVDTPRREGFKFMGWEITDMDDGTHYFAEFKSSYKKQREDDPSDNPVYLYSGNGMTTKATSLAYGEIDPKYQYFMNLRYSNGTVKIKAIWMDIGEAQIVDPWGGYGAEMRNYNVAGDGTLVRSTDLQSGTRSGSQNTNSLVTSNTGTFLNPDSNLALYTVDSRYSIDRQLGTVVSVDGPNAWLSVSNIVKQDGAGNTIYKSLKYYSYATIYSGTVYPKYILGIDDSPNSNPAEDPQSIHIGQYPYVYGTTQDGQRYYPGTWTNKSVTIKATAYDGVDITTGTINGGSGISRMKFDRYARTYEGDTEEKKDDWIKNPSTEIGSSMSIEKTFSASGIYQVSIMAEDRAGEGNAVQDGSWIPNPNGSNTATCSYGYADADTSELDKKTAILIDKDAPVVFDPENYLNASTSNGTVVTDIWGSMTYAEAKAMMYEGYNDVVDPSAPEEEAYGWAMDYVRVVTYADDGEGSGINMNDASFCWVPENSGVDYKNAKNWQGADSFRTVNGKKYPVSTRVVAEEEKGVVYIRDAVGNVAMLSYNVDHMDKEDPMVHPDIDPDPDPDPPTPPTPDPEDPTDPDNEDHDPDPDDPYTWYGSGDIEYDWINHVAHILLSAEDLVADSDKRPVSGSGSKTDEKHSSSGIWKMTVYPSDNSFTTVEDARGRQRSPHYNDGGSYSTVLFKNQIDFTASDEGTNCYIVEVLDKAGNLTVVKFVVKIDMTNPTIGGSEKQVNLNSFSDSEISEKIKQADLMSCTFDISFDDRKGSEDASDTSGVEYIKLRLINPEDPDNTYGENREYVLYQYGSTPSGFSKIASPSLTLENELNFSSLIKNSLAELTDTSVLSGRMSSKLNTFEMMPHAASFFWECEVKDRAGNCSFERSRIIPNFSVKAVIHSTEDDAFNIDANTELEITSNGGKSVSRRYYTYKYTRPVGNLKVFGNTGNENKDKYYTTYYKLSDFAANALGLTLVSSPDESVAVGMETSNKYEATNTVPYFQLGDFGYVEVWTIGYVDKIQLDFDVNGQDTIGKEMDSEISANKVPEKYALGSQSKKRYILSTKADAVLGTGRPNRDDGVPYASHYGVSEEALAAWQDEGTSIRIPLYYKLVPDGTKKDDGSDNYQAELHTAAVYAWKNGWKDTSLAEYVIYDTRADDVHYRVTHE